MVFWSQYTKRDTYSAKLLIFYVNEKKIDLDTQHIFYQNNFNFCVFDTYQLSALSFQCKQISIAIDFSYYFALSLKHVLSLLHSNESLKVLIGTILLPLKFHRGLIEHFKITNTSGCYMPNLK